MAALTQSKPRTEDVDDGWQAPSAEDRMLSLIREALYILEGEVPDEIVCSGEGWSLIDPDSVRKATHAAPAAPKPSFLAIVHEALDEALADGWCLADETDD
jgi:hypothetical protein